MARPAMTVLRLVAYPAEGPKIDTGLANVARAWNYLVGGKDNFEVDREAASARRPAQMIPLYGVVARRP
jgi:hypothetical protein